MTAVPRASVAVARARRGDRSLEHQGFSHHLRGRAARLGLRQEIQHAMAAVGRPVACSVRSLRNATVAAGETSLVGHLGGSMQRCCFAVDDCRDLPEICNNWAATCSSIQTALFAYITSEWDQRTDHLFHRCSMRFVAEVNSPRAVVSGGHRDRDIERSNYRPGILAPQSQVWS